MGTSREAHLFVRCVWGPKCQCHWAWSHLQNPKSQLERQRSTGNSAPAVRIAPPASASAQYALAVSVSTSGDGARGTGTSLSQAAFAPTSAGLRSQRHSGCQGQPDVGVSLWPSLRTWHVHLSLGLSRLSLSTSKRPSKSGSISGFKGLPVGQVQVLMRVLPPAADPPQRGAH